MLGGAYVECQNVSLNWLNIVLEATGRGPNGVKPHAHTQLNYTIPVPHNTQHNSAQITPPIVAFKFMSKFFRPVFSGYTASGLVCVCACEVLLFGNLPLIGYVIKELPRALCDRL